MVNFQVRSLISVFLVHGFLFWGCNTTPSESKVQDARPATPLQQLTPAQFLDLFKNIEADSFFIASTNDAADMTNFRFKGAELDSSCFKFFG
ncbi:MAG TPA: hypothetical protein PK228_09425, partial [Saprospiraceae bacterium]|nr:hypothetical protein [Saprospiraceae bacterium]